MYRHRPDFRLAKVGTRDTESDPATLAMRRQDSVAAIEELPHPQPQAQLPRGLGHNGSPDVLAGSGCAADKVGSGLTTLRAPEDRGRSDQKAVYPFVVVAKNEKLKEEHRGNPSTCRNRASSRRSLPPIRRWLYRRMQFGLRRISEKESLLPSRRSPDSPRKRL